MILRFMIFLAFLSACGSRDSGQPPRDKEPALEEYRWTKIVDSAIFNGSANLQLLNIRDTIWAFDTLAVYYSTDGKEFTHWNANADPLSPATSSYVFFNNRVISLTRRTNADGHEESICVESIDFQYWTVHSTSLPLQSSYQPIYFNGKLWVYTDQSPEENTTRAWNSTSGIEWRLVADSLPFDVTSPPLLVVFRKKLLLLSSACFQSDDGMHWKKLPLISPGGLTSKSILAFNDRVWLFGSSMAANDSSAVYFSKDLNTWDSMAAPWTARANPAACVFRARVLLSGGNQHRSGTGSDCRNTLTSDVWEFSNKNKTIN